MIDAYIHAYLSHIIRSHYLWLEFKTPSLKGTVMYLLYLDTIIGDKGGKLFFIFFQMLLLQKK